MDAILCPTLLFIDDADWENEQKHDVFLNNLQKTLEYIIHHKVLVNWNDELECMLWEQPNLHPWLSQDTSATTLLLYNCIKVRGESCGYSICDSDPNIESNIQSKDIISPTLSLIHFLIEQGENFSFVVDEMNNHPFVFSCECHRNNLIPEILYLLEDNINISDEIAKKWNDIKRDSMVFTELLETIRKKYFSDKPFVYQPQYETSFINSIFKTPEKKERILYDITYRLTLLPHEAAKIQGFNDEDIKNQGKRSFRVNDVCRVYYEYQKGDILLLKEYTGASEHDKGTRHT